MNGEKEKGWDDTIWHFSVGLVYVEFDDDSTAQIAFKWRLPIALICTNPTTLDRRPIIYSRENNEISQPYYDNS